LCAGLNRDFEGGTKGLLAVVDGYWESTQSWRELLQPLKRQGLLTAPKLTIGDGSLLAGITRRMRTGGPAMLLGTQDANILDKMPKSV
jgi:hypothetical protein